MNKLANHHVIENVSMIKHQGKVAYQGSISGSMCEQVTYSKYFDQPAGMGYQRHIKEKQCKEIAKYLSNGTNALFPPIILNACSEWEFVPYDPKRPFGRLLIKNKATRLDGQHRILGTRLYERETNSEISIPFMAYHFLDEDDERKLFDIINTKAKGIGPSLSKFIRRDSDELSWIATELVTRNESPFHQIGSIIGNRTKGRHITLSNIYRFIYLLTREQTLTAFTKEEKLNIALTYFNGVKDLFSDEWKDYSMFKLSHIVCLEALSIAGKSVLIKNSHKTTKKVDFPAVLKHLNKLKVIDWSTDGPLKYLKGLRGSKSLSEDLKEIMLQG